ACGRQTGPLPPEQVKYLEVLRQSRMVESNIPLAYLVDRLRQQSRILEPVQKVEPYRYIKAGTGDLERGLAELPDITDRKALILRIQQLLKDASRPNLGHAPLLSVLHVALDQAPRGGEDFSLDMLRRLTTAYDAAPAELDLVRRLELLEKALFVAAHFD